MLRAQKKENTWLGEATGEKNLTDKKNFYGKKLISKELFDKVLKLNRIKHFFKRTALVVTFAISTNRPLGVS